MKQVIVLCIISAIVDSYGTTINVDHLQRIVSAGSGSLVYQYDNPYVIHSDWNIDRVADSIMFAAKRGCGGV